jgi:DNA-binding response OmpR family regulator
MPEQIVLVVDDSPTILSLAETVLARAGLRVIPADCGEAAIQSAIERTPDLILLDYLLPDINGDDVCRAISGNMTLANVPVVVMSARSEAVASTFARLGNVVDVLPKPFSPDALLAVVTHALKQHGRRRSTVPDTTVDADSLELPSLNKANTGSHAALAAQDAALAGDLAVISIADVLLLLQDRQLTGLLRTDNGKAHLEITVCNGRVDFAGARGVPEEFLLGHFLVRARQVDEDALDQVIAERHHTPGCGLLGADLCRRGLLSPAGLRKAMTRQTVALVYEGLRWESGRFSFHPNEPASPEAEEAALGLAADGLIMQGLRRIEGWRIIGKELGDFDAAFVRNDDKIDAFGRDRLLREEELILDLVNGRNTVRDLVSLSRFGSYEVTQILFRLLRSKLIRRRVAPVVA